MIFFYILDSIIIYVSFYLGYILRFDINIFSLSYPVKIPWNVYQKIMPFVILLVLFFLSVFSLYDKKKDFNLSEIILSVCKACFWSMIFLSAFTFFYRENSFSRIAFFYSEIILLIFVLSEKLLFIKFLRKKKNILIIGDSEEALILEDNFKKNKSYNCIRKTKFDFNEKFNEVIMCDLEIIHQDYDKISEYIYRNNAILKMTIDMLNIPILPRDIEIESGIPVFNFSGGLYNNSNKKLKRIFDIIISFFLIILFLPLMVYIAALILIDSGFPVFYFQDRIGKRGNKFKIIKFRTMIKGAEILQNYMKKSNEADGKIFKLKNDPRLTRVGRIIRKFYLDELPQLFNVFAGNMSIIGPRPLPESDLKDLTELPQRRYDVLPGITGLWQIHTEKKLSFNAMVKLDLYYIDNWSILLDIRIFLETIPLIIFGIGGY